MGNGGAVAGGRLRVETAVEVMSAFDNLPFEIREFLRDSVFDWPSNVILQHIQRGREPDAILRELRATEARMRRTN